jgi:hypothetical protein
VVLHLLTKRRQDLVAARTQTINRLHRLLMDLVASGARRNLTANRGAALLSQVTVTGAPAVTRRQLATELVANVRQLEQRIAEVEGRIKTAVAESKTTLLRAVRGRAGAGRHLPRRGRRHRPVPHQAPLRRPHRHRPHWRPPAAKWSATGYPGPGYSPASTTTPPRPGRTWPRSATASLPSSQSMTPSLTAGGQLGPDVARGLELRHDWGPQYRSAHSVGSLAWLGIADSPAFLGSRRPMAALSVGFAP